MENVIRKLYGMYMDNDNREKNEMSVMHDDLCKEKKEKALHFGIQKYCNDYATKKAYKDFKQV